MKKPTFFQKVRGEEPEQPPEIQNEPEQQMPRYTLHDVEMWLEAQKEKLKDRAAAAWNKTFQVAPLSYAQSDGIMDFADTQQGTISDIHVEYFGNKGFIGYQTCALLAQHWLIDNACRVPVEDANRKGWELTLNSGDELSPEQKTHLEKIDKLVNLNDNLLLFGKMGRVYGVRVAIFIIDYPGMPDNFYELPFDINGVPKGSYKGILQRDPYHCTPILGSDGSDFNSLHFYEPEFWQIAGKRYHRSHVKIYRHSEVPDVLKPSYLYGAMSVPQQIFEAVYNADVTATQIPELFQRMVMNIHHTDNIEGAIAGQADIEMKLAKMAYYRTNYSLLLLGDGESFEQFQLSLNGMDDLVAGRYKIVAACAQMPVSKLMQDGFSGGLGDSGKEEKQYHELCQTIQTKELGFLERHYELATKSAFGEVLPIKVIFNPLNVMTEQEQAQTESTKAQTRATYAQLQVFTPEEIRAAVIQDKNSGFNGLPLEMPEMPEMDFSEDNEPEDEIMPGQAVEDSSQNDDIKRKLKELEYHQNEMNKKLQFAVMDNKDIDNWIGVDLDGTLAFYDGWKGIEHIGEPIPEMLNRVKEWIENGQQVKIFTARANDKAAIPYIQEWLKNNGLPDLDITNVKDFGMTKLYDDRAIQVVENTGSLIKEFSRADVKDEMPVIVSDLDKKAHNAATSPLNNKPEPTQTEAKAGDYVKGKLKIAGIPVHIENPYGSIRKGVDSKGNKWGVELHDSYGYIAKTDGADGDEIDIFIKPHLTQEEADSLNCIYVIDQIDPFTGDFDEHKCVFGYRKMSQAKNAYLLNYAEGWQGLGDITRFSIADFKRHLEESDWSRPAVEWD